MSRLWARLVRACRAYLVLVREPSTPEEDVERQAW